MPGNISQMMSKSLDVSCQTRSKLSHTLPTCLQNMSCVFQLIVGPSNIRASQQLGAPVGQSPSHGDRLPTRVCLLCSYWPRNDGKSCERTDGAQNLMLVVRASPGLKSASGQHVMVLKLFPS